MLVNMYSRTLTATPLIQPPRVYGRFIVAEQKLCQSFFDRHSNESRLVDESYLKRVSCGCVNETIFIESRWIGLPETLSDPTSLRYGQFTRSNPIQNSYNPALLQLNTTSSVMGIHVVALSCPFLIGSPGCIAYADFKDEVGC